jgi:hypothetical protein
MRTGRGQKNATAVVDKQRWVQRRASFTVIHYFYTLAKNAGAIVK